MAENSLKKLIDRGFALLRSGDFLKYLVVGGTTVLLDYALLFLLREHLGSGLFSAVTVAYWLSIAYNFTLNRLWTFEAGGSNLNQHLIAYLILLGFNYLVTVGIVTGLDSIDISEYIGKTLAIGVTMIWTFFIYKKVIFVKRSD